MKYSYFTVFSSEAEENEQRTYINILVDNSLTAVLEIDNFGTSGFRLNKIYSGEDGYNPEGILTDALGHPAPWTVYDFGKAVVWAEEGTVAHQVYNVLFNY